MSKRVENNRRDEDISNVPLDIEIEDSEPPRRPDLGDSYDQDFEDEVPESTKAVKNSGASTLKSPFFNKSKKSKKNMFKNASMSSVNSRKKKARGSSMLKSETVNSRVNAKFKISSKSKKRGSLVRGSAQNNTGAQFPKMAHHPLTRSQPKFLTQMGFKSKAVKKAPMMIIEETIEKAKIRMEIVAKKREKANQAMNETKKEAYLKEESNILSTELKNLNIALNLLIEQMKDLKLNK